MLWKGGKTGAGFGQWPFPPMLKTTSSQKRPLSVKRKLGREESIERTSRVEDGK